MLQKTVRCPTCKQTTIVAGVNGEIVKVICQFCGSKGKVTFGQRLKPEDVAIEVFHLTKIYDDLTAVNDISFRVKKGEIFAFLGPNGAGKTTTVEIIESIRIPTAGSVKIFGRDIKNEFEEIKDKIGILPQEFHSFERLTVRETLVYFSKLYKKHANIDDIIDGLDLKSHEKILYRNLSGGLKQRVGVAISLVNDPDIIFLDEPTTGLDPKARREVWEVIADLRNKGKTVFLTTHYMEEAEFLADHIAVIHKGNIIAEGSLEDLIGKYGKKSILHVKECSDKKVAQVLKDKGFEVTTNHNNDIEIVIEFKDQILEVLSNLRHECVDYESIDIRRSNLEEVFLTLTGASLREEKP